MASLTMLRRPRQIIYYATESLFLRKTLSDSRGLPQKAVFEVIPAENVHPILLGNLQHGVGWFQARAWNSVDLVNLCLLCQILKPAIVFEIGTWRGYTALHLALNTPEEAKVYTLDLPKGELPNPGLKTTLMDDSFIRHSAEEREYCFQGTSVERKVHCLFGDSASFDFSDFEGAIDLFFIDGAHSYDYVRSDTLNALKCCHPGSVIAWHDFGHMGVNGVSKLLLELSGELEIYTVPGGSLAFSVLGGPESELGAPVDT